MDETGPEIARGFGSGYPGGEALKIDRSDPSNSCSRISHFLA